MTERAGKGRDRFDGHSGSSQARSLWWSPISTIFVRRILDKGLEASRCSLLGGLILNLSIHRRAR